MKVTILLLLAAMATVHGSGKKGHPSFNDGKKGMSMSISMEEGGNRVAKACNSGRVSCSSATTGGCKQFEQSNPFESPIADTDECLAFCEGAMDTEDYYIEFRPFTLFGAVCRCFEGCALFLDVAENPATFSISFAVGENECEYFQDPMDEFCDGQTVTTCAESGTDVRCADDSVLNIEFASGATPDNCANFCLGAFGAPYFAFNMARRDCFCYNTCDSAMAVNSQTGSFLIYYAASDDTTVLPCPLPPSR